MDKKQIMGFDRLKCPLHKSLPFIYICKSCKNIPLCEICYNEHNEKNLDHHVVNCKAAGEKKLKDAQLDLKNQKENKIDSKSNEYIQILTKNIREMFKKCEQEFIGNIKTFVMKMKGKRSYSSIEKYVKNMEKYQKEKNFIKMYQEEINYTENAGSKESNDILTENLLKNLMNSVDTLKAKIAKLNEENKLKMQKKTINF